MIIPLAFHQIGFDWVLIPDTKDGILTMDF